MKPYIAPSIHVSNVHYGLPTVMAVFAASAAAGAAAVAVGKLVGDNHNQNKLPSTQEIKE